MPPESSTIIGQTQCVSFPYRSARRRPRRRLHTLVGAAVSTGAGAARVLSAAPAGPVAVDAVDAGNSPPRRRHSAELYDAIWELEVPPIIATDGKGAGRLNRDGGPTIAVGATAVRVVLMAMARHTNPSRDQVRGPVSVWRCCPTVE